MKLRIYIVDDHALFRKGLAALINAESDMEVCGEGEDCAVATQNILRIKPDLVIVDISLKGNNGIELIKNIKAVEPQIQVVVLSMHDESIYALRVLRVGAKAYVMKQDAATAVVDAIRWVRKGQLYVSEYVASQMLNRYAQGEEIGDDSPVSSLSDRELEVLNLIGSGVPTREIAARLHVSIKTIETHRAHIKSKLNLTSASQLIQFCVRWVDRSPHVVHNDSNPPQPTDPNGPIPLPNAAAAPTERKFNPSRTSASITTLVRSRARTVSTSAAKAS
jgi:DNA-binding NarL/FixJ family response regulator